MRASLGEDTRFLKLQELLASLELEHELPAQEIIRLAQETRIPLSLYAGGLSTLELTTKYLVENIGWTLSQTARTLHRSRQNVGQAYRHAKLKMPENFAPEISDHDIPLIVLLHPKRSLLESVVCYLREDHHLTFSIIAKMLYRDPRTIWTTYQRAKKK